MVSRAHGGKISSGEKQNNSGEPVTAVGVGIDRQTNTGDYVIVCTLVLSK